MQPVVRAAAYTSCQAVATPAKFQHAREERLHLLHPSCVVMHRLLSGKPRLLSMHFKFCFLK